MLNNGSRGNASLVEASLLAFRGERREVERYGVTHIRHLLNVLKDNAQQLFHHTHHSNVSNSNSTHSVWEPSNVSKNFILCQQLAEI